MDNEVSQAKINAHYIAHLLLEEGPSSSLSQDEPATIQDESLLLATNIMAMCTCNVSCMLFWHMYNSNTNQLLDMMTNHDKSWPSACGSAPAESRVHRVQGNPQTHRAYKLMVSCSISMTTAGRLASAVGTHVTVLECAQSIHSCSNC